MALPRRALALILLLAAGLLAACDGSGPPFAPLPSGVYDGVYIQGIEDSVFEPCSRGYRDETWQLAPTEEADVFGDRYRELVRSGHYHIYMRLEGTPSRRARFEGFFQVYDRRFEVTGVVEMQGTENGQCPWWVR